MVMEAAGRPDGIAVVTGAAGGMGSSCAEHLVEGGWNELLLCDLDEARLATIAAPLRDKGAEVDTLAGDLSGSDYPNRLVGALGGRPVSALIHTAGLGPQMAAKDRIFDVNLDAGIRMLATIRPHLSAGSAVIMFASIAGRFAVSPEADSAFDLPIPPVGSKDLRHLAANSNDAYLLSKRAVLALVRREAKELYAERGARIISVSPGVIETAMTRDVTDPHTIGMLQGAAIPRLGHPHEVAAACAFLCSPGASFITGCDLRIDGGELATMGF